MLIKNAHALKTPVASLTRGVELAKYGCRFKKCFGSMLHLFVRPLDRGRGTPKFGCKISHNFLNYGPILKIKKVVYSGKQ